jgi:ketosteroid isomerase-like protein
MTQARDIATVRAIYDAFARRDVEAALEHVSEQMRFLPQATAGRVGREAPYHGHNGVRQYFADADRAWEELTLHADDIRADPRGIVATGRVEGVLRGERVERTVVWIWQVRDGKAVAMRVS